SWLHSRQIRPFLPTEVVEAVESKASIALRPEGQKRIRPARFSWHIHDRVCAGDFGGADQLCQRMLQGVPERAQAFECRVTVLKGLGRDNEAEAALRRARELKAERPDCYDRLLDRFRMKPIIITAADANFFEMVQGTILSVRQKAPAGDVAIGFFD